MTLISLFFTNARNGKKIIYMRPKIGLNGPSGTFLRGRKYMYSGAVGHLRILRRNAGQFKQTVNIFTVSSVSAWHILILLHVCTSHNITRGHIPIT